MINGNLVVKISVTTSVTISVTAVCFHTYQYAMYAHFYEILKKILKYNLNCIDMGLIAVSSE